MEQLLRRELKSWQKAFKAQHGRDPTKRDILADPAIAGTYDTWQAAGGDVKAKSKSRSSTSSRSSDASSSKQRLDREEVSKTPSKRKPHSAATTTSTPSRNPFRTPTKSRCSPAKATVTPGAGCSRNPFASPSKPSANEPVSPARSLIEVEMTPTKRSPLLDTFARRNNFTPTKSPSHTHHQQQYITSSPSKLRTTLEASLPSRRTPTKSPKSRAASDAALNAALVAYTPRTKARKRLRGEDVPPTPSARRVVSAGSVAVSRTDPRPVQRGLGTFGFASNRKLSVQEKGSAAAPSSGSVFSRERGGAQSNGKFASRGPGLGDEEEDEEMQTESPIKAVAKLRRSASSAKGFRPLFASPSSNHAPQNMLGVPPPTKSHAHQHMADDQDDADALMEDDSSSLPVGGLFAAEVQQRRLRRARETESSSLDTTGMMKRHKIRALVQLPSSNVSDNEDDGGAAHPASSSPASFCRAGALSSPHTELTVPSSTIRPTTTTTEHSFLSKQHSKVADETASSPTRGVEPVSSNIGIASEAGDALEDSAAERAVEASRIEGWRRVQRVELSDDDEPRGKVISITPYQRYGTLRTASSPLLPSSALVDEEEEDYAYTIPTRNRQVYAVDTTSSPGSDSDADADQTHASLAGLKLSPVRHARSKARERDRLLNSIFDPSAAKARTVFNPEARCGPLQPSTRTAESDYDDEDPKHPISTHAATLAHASDDDDDDDWQQEVDEDFTFIDSEIELQDVA